MKYENPIKDKLSPTNYDVLQFLAGKKVSCIFLLIGLRNYSCTVVCKPDLLRLFSIFLFYAAKVRLWHAVALDFRFELSKPVNVKR